MDNIIAQTPINKTTIEEEKCDTSNRDIWVLDTLDQDEAENMRRLKEQWGNLPMELAELLEYELGSMLEYELDNFVKEVSSEKIDGIDYHGIASSHPGGLTFKMDNGDNMYLVPSWKALVAKPL